MPGIEPDPITRRIVEAFNPINQGNRPVRVQQVGLFDEIEREIGIPGLVGEAPVAKNLDVAEHAAWTAVARVLLNLHETINRS